MHGQSQSEARVQHLEDRLAVLEWRFRRLAESAAEAFQPSFSPLGGGGVNVYIASVTTAVTAAVDGDTPGSGVIKRYLGFDGTDLITLGANEPVYNTTSRTAVVGETIMVVPAYGGWVFAPIDGTATVAVTTTTVSARSGATYGTGTASLQTDGGTAYVNSGPSVTVKNTLNKAITSGAYVQLVWSLGKWRVVAVGDCANVP